MLFFSVAFNVSAAYEQKFDNLKVTPKADFVPEGWSRIVASMSWYGDGPYYLAYKAFTSGGKDGAYLRAPRQRIVYPEYEDDYVDCNDILITPAVKGDISIWHKAVTSTSFTYIEVYACTPSGDTFEKGELLQTVKSADMSTSAWKEFTFRVEEPTYLGFKFSNVNVDEFTAETLCTEAEDKVAIEISDLSIINAEPLPSPDNTTEIAYNVTVKNTGTVALAPGAENYTLSVEKYMNNREVIATVPVDVALDPGESAMVRVAASVNPGDKETRYRYDVVENISGARLNGSWVTVKPYKAEVVLCQASATATKDMTGVLGYGIVKDEPVVRTLGLSNTGGAPLELTSVDLPSGYTTSLAFPATVAPSASVEFDVTLSPGAAGVKAGTMTFHASGMEDKSYKIAGGVAGDGVWMEDFENGLPPYLLQIEQYEGYPWKEVALADEYDGCGLGKTAVDCGGVTMLVSPKLKFDEGGQMIFSAAQEAYSSVMRVYYSTDRVEWEELLTIGGLDSYGDAVKEYDTYFSNVKVTDKGENYEFVQFLVTDIPAGEGYIAFETGRARLDNVLGGTPADSGCDILLKGHSHPKKGVVNEACHGRIILQNLMTTQVGPEDYTVILHVGDEDVELVERPVIAAGAEADLQVAFTPHAVGTFPVYMTLKTGDAEVHTPGTVLKIEAEEALIEHITGTPTGAEAKVPLSSTYTQSVSQFIYSAGELGLNSGDEISKIEFYGFVVSDKDVTNNIRLWMENTEVCDIAASTARDVADFDPVYTGTWTPEFDGDSDNHVAVLTIRLKDPFVYTGNNVLMALESVSDDFKAVYFETCTTGTSIYKRTDTEDGLAAESWIEQAGRPVAHIYSPYEVHTVSGTILDYHARTPVEGAEILLQSGDVRYSAVSDAYGAYSIGVIKHDLDYEMTVSKEHYNTSQPRTVNCSEGNVTEDVIIMQTGMSGVTDVSVGSLEVKVVGKDIVAPEGAEVYDAGGRKVSGKSLVSGIYIVRCGEDAVKVFVP